MKIKFIEETTLEVTEVEGNEPVVETFAAGEVAEVDIYGENDFSFDVQFGDGSVTTIIKGSFVVL